MLSKATGILLAVLPLCFSGRAFADGNSEQTTAGFTAQRASDPSSLEKVSTSEYARAHQFTDGPGENALESVEASKDVIPDARQLTARADAINRPVRVFDVVSHNNFRPIGETIAPASNQEIATPPSFLDNPEYYVLLVFGIVLLVIMAFGRRWDNNYRLEPVGR